MRGGGIRLAHDHVIELFEDVSGYRHIFAPAIVFAPYYPHSWVAGSLVRASGIDQKTCNIQAKGRKAGWARPATPLNCLEITPFFKGRDPGRTQACCARPAAGRAGPVANACGL
jgi:hypothetical protein